jgi:hypothetical protein
MKMAACEPHLTEKNTKERCLAIHDTETVSVH